LSVDECDEWILKIPVESVIDGFHYELSELDAIMLQIRSYLIPEDRNANLSFLIDTRMVYLGGKRHLAPLIMTNQT
jgi:hypothetical protein